MRKSEQRWKTTNVCIQCRDVLQEDGRCLQRGRFCFHENVRLVAYVMLQYANFTMLHTTETLTNYTLVGFQVLTPVVMKSSTSWNITPYSPLKINRHSVWTFRLHLQDLRTSRARNKLCLTPSFKPVSCLAYEDGGDMFLWNIGWLEIRHEVLYPRR
jgi:hypothetical protein